MIQSARQRRKKRQDLMGIVGIIAVFVIFGGGFYFVPADAFCCNYACFDFHDTLFRLWVLVDPIT